MWHFEAGVACLVCWIRRENGSIPFLSSHSGCLNEVSVWNRQLLLSHLEAPPSIAYQFVSVCLWLMSVFYYCKEWVSGIVCVFVVLVLERIRRWVCGLRCPADLSGHMRSICEVSRSVSVRTLQSARQLLALLVGKDFGERFATQL